MRRAAHEVGSADAHRQPHARAVHNDRNATPAAVRESAACVRGCSGDDRQDLTFALPIGCEPADDARASQATLPRGPNDLNTTPDAEREFADRVHASGDDRQGLTFVVPIGCEPADDAWLIRLKL